MKFKTCSSDKADRAFEALGFLRHAVKVNELSKIENIDEVLDALDISQDLAYYEQLLKENYINY